MNMFSKSPVVPGASAVNVSSFQYRSTNDRGLEVSELEEQELSAEPEVRLTERSLNERLSSERAAGYAAAQAVMQRDFEQRSEVEQQRVIKAIADFEKSQKVYFSRVEAEVVQLALAIAGKILHREAQVDPMLLSAIVHLALGQLKEGSSATIRVRPEQANQWRMHITALAINLDVKVVEDIDLERGDCVLETELGTVNFSLDAQLKEVERGFFDVLAQKP
ncbi:flagellar assembly protein FliH [Granulicella aggregans]|uniref:Flagellar assembly protein FliH n=1 Tax=Granulicella aggregans TaxID=474949 RepID=A0A7W7ZAU9_9BACT|nr:FliH/SctL family protein [Granulicella aggregans]MBB5056398.1 flagellar assembly protein FliH [Granulicella aggregans]